MTTKASILSSLIRVYHNNIGEHVVERELVITNLGDYKVPTKFGIKFPTGIVDSEVCQSAELELKCVDGSNDGPHVRLECDHNEGALLHIADPVVIPCRIPLYHAPWTKKDTVETGVTSILGALFSMTFWLPVLTNVSTSAITVILRGLFSPKPRLPFSLSAEYNTEIPKVLSTSLFSGFAYTLNLQFIWNDHNIIGGKDFVDLWWKPNVYAVSTECYGYGPLVLEQGAKLYGMLGTWYCLFEFTPSIDLSLEGLTNAHWTAHKLNDPDDVYMWAYDRPVIEPRVYNKDTFAHPLHIGLGDNVLVRAGTKYRIAFQWAPEDHTPGFAITHCKVFAVLQVITRRGAVEAPR